MTGQNTLVSKRVVVSGMAKIVYTSGETMEEKTHTEIGTIVNLSIIVFGVGPFRVGARGAPVLACLVALITVRPDIPEFMPLLILRIHLCVSQSFP
jgi:hypothetical protein